MAKNITKLMLMMVIAYIILPTGPTDVFVIPFIISKIGMEMYIIISILLIVYIYKTIEGKTLSDKLKMVGKEIRSLFK